MGHTFTETQASSGAHVAVVGPSIAEVLFGSDTAAVGKTIRIGFLPFRILGVMKDYGSNLNNNVVMPETAARVQDRRQRPRLIQPDRGLSALQ
ncbi:ABC transporter permease [Pseudonocardia sp. Cha107L01]|uniref:ABC transporter permease n=1 Tax=Pseudonocardia sp. Cha107L01 TaxID=3457576 RepID=UPI00403EE1BB